MVPSIRYVPGRSRGCEAEVGRFGQRRRRFEVHAVTACGDSLCHPRARERAEPSTMCAVTKPSFCARKFFFSASGRIILWFFFFLRWLSSYTAYHSEQPAHA